MNKELFLEHYEIKRKYFDAKNKYNKLLEKKAMLIINVQPKATNLNKKNLCSEIKIDKFENFIERLETLDPEIQQARNERDLQEYLLKKKEIELSDSIDILNRIYFLKYVKHYKIRVIAINTNYSRSQIYRKIDEINIKIKDETK